MLHARFCSHLSHLSSLQRIWRPVSRFDLQDPVLDIQIIPEITVPVTGTVGPIVMITGCPTAPNPFICRRGPLTSGHLPNVEETDIAPDGTINHPIGTVSTHRLSYCTSTNTLEFTLQSTLPQPRHSGQISRAGYSERRFGNVISAMRQREEHERFIPLDRATIANASYNGGLVVLHDLNIIRNHSARVTHNYLFRTSCRQSPPLRSSLALLSLCSHSNHPVLIVKPLVRVLRLCNICFKVIFIGIILVGIIRFIRVMLLMGVVLEML
jgi:hypothetical protein